MDEWSIAILLASILPWLWYLAAVLDRKFADRTAERTKPRPSLTPLERSEIYQDMEWWDREFRRLSGEPEPVTEPTSSVSWGVTLEEAARNLHRAFLNGADRVSDPKPPTTTEIEHPTSRDWHDVTGVRCPRCHSLNVRGTYPTYQCWTCKMWMARPRPNVSAVMKEAYR